MTTVYLAPGDNIQQAVDANPAGTEFVLEPGVYRGQEISPKDYQQFIGEPGAILNGSVVLSHWTQANGYWQATGLPTLAPPSGVAGSNPEAPYPNDLFVNDTVYTRVASLSQMGHDTWYADPTTGTAYLSDDPTGKTVELSTTPFAFGQSSATGVVIQGLTVEKYANPAQTGAIQWGGNGWQMINDTVTLNHGGGIQLSQNSIVEGGQVINNGELGIGAWHATNAEIIGVEVAGNNYAGFSTGWEAGGIKVDNSTGVQILDSYIHDNNGPGIWSDDNAKGLTYAGNLIAHNTGSGIVQEISYDAVIRDNVLLQNGTSTSGQDPVGGDGIFIHDSQNTQVYGNYVEVGASAGNGIGMAYEPRSGTPAYGPWETINNSVHDNTVVHLGASGHDGNWPYQDLSQALSWANSWANNHYVVPSAGYAFYDVGNQFYSWDALHQQQSGYETGSTLTVAQATPTAIVTAPAGSNTVVGGAGNEVLIGNGGNDLIEPGSGNDMLFGGQGNSTFVIAHGSGSDTIFDFHAGDTVQLAGFGFTDAASVAGALVQAGSDVTLDLGGGQTLLFKGETVAALSAGVFSLDGTQSTGTASAGAGTAPSTGTGQTGSAGSGPSTASTGSGSTSPTDSGSTSASTGSGSTPPTDSGSTSASSGSGSTPPTDSGSTSASSGSGSTPPTGSGSTPASSGSGSTSASAGSGSTSASTGSGSSSASGHGGGDTIAFPPPASGSGSGSQHAADWQPWLHSTHHGHHLSAATHAAALDASATAEAALAAAPHDPAVSHALPSHLADYHWH